MAQIGRDTGAVRLPLVGADEAVRKSIKSLLVANGLQAVNKVSV